MKVIASVWCIFSGFKLIELQVISSVCMACFRNLCLNTHWQFGYKSSRIRLVHDNIKIVHYCELVNISFRLPKDNVTLFSNQTKISKPSFLIVFIFIQLHFPLFKYLIYLLQDLFLPCSYAYRNLEPWTHIPSLQLLILQIQYYTYLL